MSASMGAVVGPAARLSGYRAETRVLVWVKLFNAQAKKDFACAVRACEVRSLRTDDDGRPAPVAQLGDLATFDVAGAADALNRLVGWRGKRGKIVLRWQYVLSCGVPRNAAGFSPQAAGSCTADAAAAARQRAQSDQRKRAALASSVPTHSAAGTTTRAR